MNVLSTMTRAPWRWARAMTAAASIDAGQGVRDHLEVHDARAHASHVASSSRSRSAKLVTRLGVPERREHALHHGVDAAVDVARRENRAVLAGARGQDGEVARRHPRAADARDLHALEGGQRPLERGGRRRARPAVRVARRPAPDHVIEVFGPVVDERRRVVDRGAARPERRAAPSARPRARTGSRDPCRHTAGRPGDSRRWASPAWVAARPRAAQAPADAGRSGRTRGCPDGDAYPSRNRSASTCRERSGWPQDGDRALREPPDVVRAGAAAHPEITHVHGVALLRELGDLVAVAKEGVESHRKRTPLRQTSNRGRSGPERSAGPASSDRHWQCRDMAVTATRTRSTRAASSPARESSSGPPRRLRHPPASGRPRPRPALAERCPPGAWPA